MKKSIFTGFAVLVLVFGAALTGCYEVGNGIITYSAVANGTEGVATTKIDFEFDADVSAFTLTAADITLAGGSGAATVGALNMDDDGIHGSLAIDTVTTGGAATVAINKAGIDSGAKDITLSRGGGAIIYTAVADGDGTTATTKIDFEFSADVAGLTAGDITIGGGPGAATAGILTGSGKNWSLGITTVTAGGAAAVSISKSGIEIGTKGITLYAPDPADLSIKLGITTSGTSTVQHVIDTFTAVHAYLATNPAVSGAGTAAAKIGDIELGDYVDLVSLTIGASTISNTALPGGHGKLLRLIVVGINSFQGASDSAPAITNNPGAPTHLVFQFQNVPVTHTMNSANTNAGGYDASDLKAYICGDFLTGLKTATGLADALLWAPERKVSHGNPAATDTITDALWLPTEWEMFGARAYSSQDYEVNAGQARLEYYQADADRVKYGHDNGRQWYWEASPYSATGFCDVYDGGAYATTTAMSLGGVAPAFCIK
jgi:hypothetical protein